MDSLDTLSPTDSPSFLYLDRTLRLFPMIIMKYSNVFVKLSQCDIFSLRKDNGEITYANDIFNVIVSSKEDLSDISIELPNNIFEMVVDDFYTQATNDSTLRPIIADKDKYTAMWYLCKDFFVPIRVITTSMSLNERNSQLRKWLSIVLTEPYINQYFLRFNKIIDVDHLNTYEEIINRLKEDPSIMTKTYQNMLASNVNLKLMLGESKPNGKPVMFIRTNIRIMLLASIEIMERYCPNLIECRMSNPRYNGTWLHSADQLRVRHNLKLKSLMNLCSL